VGAASSACGRRKRRFHGAGNIARGEVVDVDHQMGHFLVLGLPLTGKLCQPLVRSTASRC
jgi:hypothetical protein